MNGIFGTHKIGGYGFGVVLLAIFAFVETRAKYPLLPLRVVLNRTRGGSMLAMLFASVGIFGIFLFMTYYLQETLGFSPVKTGVAFLPMAAGLAGTAQVSNRILLPIHRLPRSPTRRQRNGQLKTSSRAADCGW